MATKWKNTEDISYFKGLISWVSSLVLVVLTCVAVVTGIFLLIFGIVSMEDFDLLVSYIQYASVVAPQVILWAVLAAVGLLAISIVLDIAFRRHRKAFESAVARLLGRLWVEPKLIALAVLFLLLFVFSFDTFYYSPYLTSCISLSWLVLLLYFLCLDIGTNRRFFGHNIIHSILVRVNRFQSKTSFQKKSLRRFYSCILVVAAVIPLCGFLFLCFFDHGAEESLFALAALVFGIAAVIGTMYWYVLSLNRDLQDWNAMIVQIDEMYGGNLDAVNLVPPTSNLYDSAMQLNMIRTGIQRAVEEGIKADRTKVELITNVSHDIKTPLTSIISYIELLKQEPDLPDHVNDYINTISNKADRLSHIVQDVFDVSKAATGNMKLDLEELDIGKLLQQTFAEMDEVIQSSPITWRLDIPDEPFTVVADGQRMYRVFQNLIRNCAQYSLEGSRAYVRVIAHEGVVTVSIRNISKAELTLSSEDLTARFVRGDINRTTEGSGLGLSIAKSFTEACGGSFAVFADGDLFTAQVQFPLVARQPAVPQLTVTPEAQPSAETPNKA